MLKSVPKKDQPKAIALGVLAVGLVGSAFYQFNSGDPRLADAAAAKAAAAKNGGTGTGRTPGAAAQTPGAAAPSGASTRLVSATSAAGVSPALVSANMSMTRITNENGIVYDLGAVGPPTGGKDPFLPVGMVTTAAAVAPPKPTVPLAAPTPAAPAPPDFGGGRLDSLLNRSGITSGMPSTVSRGGGVTVAEILNNGGGGQNGANGVAAMPSAPVALPPPPPPAVMVTGIVMGVAEPGNPAGGSVAVVRGGDGAAGTERRFVKVGDSVGSGFVVAQVRPSGIVIKSGNRRITLKLGEKPAAAGTVASPFAPAASDTGKDAPKNTDKNTNDKNTVSAPPAMGSAASQATPAAQAGSPLGDKLRAK